MRFGALKKYGFLIMGLLVFPVAVHEFFIKVSTTHLLELNALAVTLISTGSIFLLGLLRKQTRDGIITESHLGSAQ